MSKRRITIDDVAKAAGVSRQTVSNHIRGTGRVGAATADRLREVIERLDYTPHPGASSMRSNKSGQVAYPLVESSLTPDNVIVMDFIPSLVAAAGRHGYHVLLTSTGAGGMRDLVRSGRVDGFIFSDMFGYDERLAIVEETRTPFACFGRVPAGLRQAWVDVDNAGGTHGATEHVIGLGHTAILFLGHDVAYWDDERRDGYRAAMIEHGLSPRAEIGDYDVSDADLDARLRSILRASDRPTAIVCASDSLSLAVYRAAAEVGLAIGSDLAVTGFDSSVIGRSLVPSLTTMRVPVDRIAELVVQRFVAEVTAPEADVEGVLVAPELRAGASARRP